MYNKNYLATLKLGGAKRFVQKSTKTPTGHLKNLKGGKFDNVNLNHMSNSNIGIPNYTSGDLNGKGRSFNPSPHERFDNSADSFL